MRVYEFAKKHNVNSGDILKILTEANFIVKSHMSVLGDQEICLLELKYNALNNVTTNINSKINKIEAGDNKNQVIKKVVQVTLEKSHSVNLAENMEQKKLSTRVVLSNKINKKNSNYDLEDNDHDIDSHGMDSNDLSKSSEQRDMFFLDDENQFDEDASDLAKKQKRKANSNSLLDSSVFIKRKKRKRFKNNKPDKKPVVEDVLPKELVLNQAYSVAQIGKTLGLSQMQIVGFFLRKGCAYALNDIVSAEEIKRYADELGLVLKAKSIMSGLSKSYSDADSVAHKFYRRPAVVVVMGHVDHGKTTLIDHILKSNIASKEKGGITQSVRLHPVKTNNSSFLLIDTPGHEAFSLMRNIGAKITDIAVIIIAADDGIKQQTIESINIAKSMGATICVAINKVDKEGVGKNIEKIKQDLARYDLVIEEWGGDVVCSLISAKTGLGVSDLFEVIALQAELLDLKTTVELPGKAFVLESFIEKGLGVCATVFLTEGQLKIGDNFSVGNVVGRIKALLNPSTGKKMSIVSPYEPCKLVGLPSVVNAGDILTFVPLNQLEQIKSVLTLAHQEDSAFISKRFETDSIKVLLKADSNSVLSALSGLVATIQQKNIKFKGMVDIIFSSVGNVYEKDVEMAFENGAVILGMNIFVEKKALEMSSKLKVVIKTDAIIYRLSEYLESLVIEKLRSMKELKQVGKGFVKKVFDIKGRGVIAGCEITEGSFIDKGVVYCMRNGVKVGEGRVTSLQQNKKTAKEIAEGNDCGFISHGFSGWVEGDRVVCFNEVSLY